MYALILYNISAMYVRNSIDFLLRGTEPNLDVLRFSDLSNIIRSPTADFLLYFLSKIPAALING